MKCQKRKKKNMKCLSLLFERQGRGRIHLEKKRGEKALGDERKGAPDPRFPKRLHPVRDSLGQGAVDGFSVPVHAQHSVWGPPPTLTPCCTYLLLSPGFIQICYTQSTWEVKGRWGGLAYAWEKGLQVWALSRNSEQEGSGMVVSLSSLGKPLDLDIKAKDDCPWRLRNSDKPQEDLLIK